MTEKERRKDRKKEKRKKERKKEREQKIKYKCTSMASTDCCKVNIHSYRFCVSYTRISVSRVGPTRTAYSIFQNKKIIIFGQVKRFSSP